MLTSTPNCNFCISAPSTKHSALLSKDVQLGTSFSLLPSVCQCPTGSPTLGSTRGWSWSSSGGGSLTVRSGEGLPQPFMTVWRDGNAGSSDVQLEVPEVELVKGERSGSSSPTVLGRRLGHT